MPRASRRTVIKGLAAAGLAAASTGVLASARAEDLLPGGASVSRTTGEPRRAVPSSCYQCPARCGIVGFVEDGLLVKVEGNRWDPNSRGGICARGLAGLNLIDNPNRLLYPLRRVGSRGSGQWQRISWDEALDEVAALLHDVRGSDHPEEFVFEAGLELGEMAVLHFLRAYGRPSVVDERALFDANRTTAASHFWGAPATVPDAANARYILNFGANPFESGPYHLPLAQRIVDAKLRGARLVTLDPRLSNTAARSDRWLAPRPGTDGVVAAAMAQVILRRELYTDGFVRTWLGLSLDELASRLAPYTPEMAAEVSGVAARDIEGIAVEYATTQPAVVLTGGGLSNHSNGFAAETAVLVLAALTGGLDAPGGLCLPRAYPLEDTERSSPAAPPPASPGQVFDQLLAGTRRSRLYLSYRANPVYTHPDPRSTVAALTDETLVPKLVVVDDVLTETAALADLVLPAATYLESWDLQSPPSFSMVPFLALRQPIVPPPGEAREFYDLAAELARRAGGGMDDLFVGSASEFIEATIQRTPELARRVDFAELRQRGIWLDSNADPQYRSYLRSGFPTRSGRLEVSGEVFAESNLRGTPGESDGALPLMLYQPTVHYRHRTATLKWLAEISHDSDVWIHPDTAAALGLRPGQKLRVKSTLAEVVVRPHLTQGIRPGVVAMADGAGHWEGNVFSRGRAERSKDPDSELVWWAAQGNGAHSRGLGVPPRDPLGGGLGWGDVRVTVTPV